MVGQMQRFLNFVLDTSIYLIIVLVFLMIFNGAINKEEEKWISIIIYFLYYSISEFTIGQTPGKFMTKTRVISLTANKNIFFIQIFGRTLMRFIPLDMFSYLFYKRGLHDWISKTTIVKR